MSRAVPTSHAVVRLARANSVSHDRSPRVVTLTRAALVPSHPPPTNLVFRKSPAAHTPTEGPPNKVVDVPVKGVAPFYLPSLLLLFLTLLFTSEFPIGAPSLTCLPPVLVPPSPSMARRSERSGKGGGSRSGSRSLRWTREATFTAGRRYAVRPVSACVRVSV